MLFLLVLKINFQHFSSPKHWCKIPYWFAAGLVLALLFLIACPSLTLTFLSFLLQHAAKGQVALPHLSPDISILQRWKGRTFKRVCNTDYPDGHQAGHPGKRAPGFWLHILARRAVFFFPSLLLVPPLLFLSLSSLKSTVNGSQPCINHEEQNWPRTPTHIYTLHATLRARLSLLATSLAMDHFPSELLFRFSTDPDTVLQGIRLGSAAGGGGTLLTC